MAVKTERERANSLKNGLQEDKLGMLIF